MKYPLGFIVGLAALLGSCSQSPRQEAIADTAPAEKAAAPARYAPSPAGAAMPAETSPGEVAGETAPVAASPLPVPTEAVAPARLLICHAALRLKVPSLPRASPRLDSLVRASGGYLSAATETREDGEWRQQLTIRVRPNRFHALLAALGGLGTVEEKKLTTDDVTAQHADVAARLATKRAVEQRYVALLARARKISEVLEIEGKIGEVREEIESTESRLKTLDDEVGYSTIALACYQVLPQAVPEAPVVSFASRVVESFYTSWTLLTGLFIGLVAVWPLWVLAPAAWWALRRWRRRRLVA